MAEVEHRFAHLSQVTMHHIAAGAGLPVILLHGWPSTWYEWRHVIDRVAPAFRVIAPDLRGLGNSSRPLDGYDKARVAADVWELARQLGLERFHLVGHDWGGPTAFALAAAHPEAVRTLAIVDVTVPGIGPDISQGGRRWHHLFHRTPDLPEALVTGRERVYLSWFYREFSWRDGAFSEDDIDEYVRTYSQPGALRAGFAYYRNLPHDAAENARLLQSGFRLPMPVLALGGEKTEARARAMEPLESLRLIADRVEGGVIANSGHFVPEEQPAALSDRLLAFWQAWPEG